MDYEVLIVDGVRCARIPLTKGKFAIVCEGDVPKLEGHSWCAKWNGSSETYYAVAYDGGGRRAAKKISMHRFLMDAPSGTEVDHRDGDGLNNTRKNLRFATHAQNIANQRRRHNARHEYKGIRFHARSVAFPWQARITLNGKKKSLGYFKTKENAAIAYNIGAIENFREFARLNAVQETGQ